MRLKFCIVLPLMLATLPQSGWTSSDGGTYAVRGAGLIDCQTYLEERQKRSSAYLMIGGWIDGYLTGVNQYAADTYDATSFESTELFAELLRSHCEKNPADRIFPVLNAILRQRWEGRIREPSPLTGIALGEFHAQMYQETIRRVQQRLADMGLYQAEISGHFNAETISAIAEFQKTLEGFEATGFPDQATLWALFAE
jgi:hypothetical protein